MLRIQRVWGKRVALPPENVSRDSVLVYHFVVDAMGFTSAGTQREPCAAAKFAPGD